MDTRSIEDPDYRNANNHQPEDLKQWAVQYFVQVLNNYDRIQNDRFSKLEEIIERFEKQLAALTQGYMESAALLQALMSHLMNKSPEEVAEFSGHLTTARKTFLETLTYAHKLAQDGTDHFTPYTTGTHEEPAAHQESE